MNGFVIFLAVAIGLPIARGADFKHFDEMNLRKDPALPNVVADHDRKVFRGYYPEYRKMFNDRELRPDDVADSLSNAWIKLRLPLKPNMGIDSLMVAYFYQENEPLVIDSAPRGAVIHITPNDLPGQKTTRNTLNLKVGQTFKIHFSMAGYSDTKDETIVVQRQSPVFCRELDPVDSTRTREKCPK